MAAEIKRVKRIQSIALSLSMCSAARTLRQLHGGGTNPFNRRTPRLHWLESIRQLLVSVQVAPALPWVAGLARGQVPPARPKLGQIIAGCHAVKALTG
jgi:hypothetical protein